HHDVARQLARGLAVADPAGDAGECPRVVGAGEVFLGVPVPVADPFHQQARRLRRAGVTLCLHGTKVRGRAPRVFWDSFGYLESRSERPVRRLRVRPAGPGAAPLGRTPEAVAQGLRAAGAAARRSPARLLE